MTSPEIRVRRPSVPRWTSFSVASLLILAVPAPGRAQDPSAQVPTGKLASTGVYTDAQARRGEASFKKNCVSCHATSDYTGEKFKMSWVSRSAYDLFDVIRTQMPEDNPGALPRQDYVDLVAYMFSLNRFPAGADELSAEDEGLKAVKIDDPPPGVSWSPAASRGGRVVDLKGHSRNGTWPGGARR